MYNGNTVVMLIPAFNEEENIAEVVGNAPKDIIDEVLVIDDGSADKTAYAAKKAGGTVISLKKNSGLGIAFKVGFRHILEKDYDICVIIGGDNQDDPRESVKLIDKIANGYDMAQGSRYKGKTRHIPLFRLMTTKAYSLFFSLVAGKYVSDASTGYKAFRVSILKKIKLDAKWLDARYGIEQYLLMQSIKKGYRYGEVPVKKYFPKKFSKMRKFIDWWWMLLPIIRSIGD